MAISFSISAKWWKIHILLVANMSLSCMCCDHLWYHKFNPISLCISQVVLIANLYITIIRYPYEVCTPSAPQQHALFPWKFWFIHRMSVHMVFDGFWHRYGFNSFPVNDNIEILQLELITVKNMCSSVSIFSSVMLLLVEKRISSAIYLTTLDQLLIDIH